jgi:hypothetical protein
MSDGMVVFVMSMNGEGLKDVIAYYFILSFLLNSWAWKEVFKKNYPLLSYKLFLTNGRITSKIVTVTAVILKAAPLQAWKDP